MPAVATKKTGRGHGVLHMHNTVRTPQILVTVNSFGKIWGRKEATLRAKRQKMQKY